MAKYKFVNVDPKTHKNMTAIKSHDTKPELALRKALWHHGYRYRKNWKALPGTPDVAITKYRIAIFCDGEYFHGKDWEKRKFRIRSGKNGQYWYAKISRNIERDGEVNRELHGMDWTVLRFWGNDIVKHTDDCVRVVDEAVFERKMEEC